MKINYGNKPKYRSKSLRLLSPGEVFVIAREFDNRRGGLFENETPIYMIAKRNGHICYFNLINGEDRPLNDDTPVYRVDCALEFYGIKAD